MKLSPKIKSGFLSLMLIAALLAAMTQTVQAKIIFKNEFLIEDNGSDTFILDAGNDMSGSIRLQFGSSLAESITFNAVDSWFEFSNHINLNQNQIKNVIIDNSDTAPASPLSGQIYHNTINGNTYVWNGVMWEDITATGGTGNDDLDTVYATDLDKVMNVNDPLGLEFNSTVPSNIRFNMQSTGDVVFQDSGTTFATFTDTGEFRIDNLQMDGNSITSTNTNGNITIDPNGTGFVNLGANVNVNGETVVLDFDNTGGNITLQFGQALAEFIRWNSALAQFELSDDLNVSGYIGQGTTTPTVNFHAYDTSSTAAHAWQMFDNGTNKVSILTGTQNPTMIATNADTGSLFLNTDTGRLYTKADDGMTINWYPSGLDYNVYGALVGTFGTPGINNKFVTDTDPRLQNSTGSFGEVALGTHLDYGATNQSIPNIYIYYTRIFLPSDTAVRDFAIHTTQARTGLVNYGIYSNDPIDINGRPYMKLAETGVINSTSPINDFWIHSLATPLEISTAGLYWLAYASDQSPKAHMYLAAEDSFIPFRVETKLATSATLPAIANPNLKGNSYNLPYLAGFEYGK